MSVTPASPTPSHRYAIQLSCGATYLLNEVEKEPTEDQVRSLVEHARWKDVITAFKAKGEQVTATVLSLRVCVVCGHSQCPHCGNWCDENMPLGYKDCAVCRSRGPSDAPGHTCDQSDLEPCCDMQCTYAEPQRDEPVLTITL